MSPRAVVTPLQICINYLIYVHLFICNLGVNIVYVFCTCYCIDEGVGGCAQTWNWPPHKRQVAIGTVLSYLIWNNPHCTSTLTFLLQFVNRMLRMVSSGNFSYLTLISFGLVGSFALVASFTFAALGSFASFALSLGWNKWSGSIRKLLVLVRLGILEEVCALGGLCAWRYRGGCFAWSVTFCDNCSWSFACCRRRQYGCWGLWRGHWSWECFRHGNSPKFSVWHLKNGCSLRIAQSNESEGTQDTHLSVVWYLQ